MRLIDMLVATLASLSQYVGANELPERIPRNTIFTLMDGRIYKSERMRRYEQWFYPAWMQRAHVLEGITADVVFLRPYIGLVYEGTLLSDHSEATGSSSHSSSSTPVSARVHVVEDGEHIYYKADNFQIEPILNNRNIRRATDKYPRINYIYIARRRGQVYSAPIIDETPYIGPHHNGAERFAIPGADGLQVLIPNNNIFVRMDGKIYVTEQINMRSWNYCPKWLQQRQFLNTIEHDSIYIRPRSLNTYEATLFDNDRTRPSQAGSHHSAPRSVRIHLVEAGHHSFHRAGEFESFPVPYEERPEHASHEYVPENNIYIARKGGLVYRARLIDFIAPQGMIPKDRALHMAIHL